MYFCHNKNFILFKWKAVNKKFKRLAYTFSMIGCLKIDATH